MFWYIILVYLTGLRAAQTVQLLCKYCMQVNSYESGYEVIANKFNIY
jgi:hypothetical protein